MRSQHRRLLVVIGFPLLFVALFFALLPKTAYAATLTVTTTVDENDGSCVDGDCSIRDAIAVAVAGDTISIPAGSYNLSIAQLTIGKSLTVVGAGSGSTVINGTPAMRVLQVNTASTVVTLTGLTLANGKTADGGCLYLNAGQLTLNDVLITSCTATNRGGGIYNFNGRLTLNSGQIFLNTALSGGGVYVDRATTTFTQVNGSIERNTATGKSAGAGIFINRGSYTLQNGQVMSNTATIAPGNVFPGGGLYIGTGVVTLNGGEIRGNYAHRGGGLVNNSGRVTLNGSQITNNSATYGGGVYLVQTAALFTQNGGLIGYNTANPLVVGPDFGGGGVYVFNGRLVTTGGQISYNHSTHNGGGVHVATGKADLSGVQMVGNSANNVGGAVHVRNSGGVITITNSSLVGNTPNAISIANNAVGGGAALVRGNTIDNHTTVFRVAAGSLTAYANNISTFTTGVSATGGVFNGRHNWWGAVAPANINHSDANSYRLGAAVVSWGIGSLPDGASLSGGTGVGVVVNHGTAVPFALPSAPSGTPCSNFYDFFTAPGAAGTWTVQLPVSSDPACDTTFNNGNLYHFKLTGSNAPDTACTPGVDCWLPYAGVTAVPGTPRLLSVSLTTAELGGTPLVAGDENGNAP